MTSNNMILSSLVFRPGLGHIPDHLQGLLDSLKLPCIGMAECLGEGVPIKPQEAAPQSAVLLGQPEQQGGGGNVVGQRQAVALVDVPEHHCQVGHRPG